MDWFRSAAHDPIKRLSAPSSGPVRHKPRISATFLSSLGRSRPPRAQGDGILDPTSTTLILVSSPKTTLIHTLQKRTFQNWIDISVVIIDNAVLGCYGYS